MATKNNKVKDMKPRKDVKGGGNKPNIGSPLPPVGGGVPGGAANVGTGKGNEGGANTGANTGANN